MGRAFFGGRDALHLPDAVAMPVIAALREQRTDDAGQMIGVGRQRVRLAIQLLAVGRQFLGDFAIDRLADLLGGGLVGQSGSGVAVLRPARQPVVRIVASQRFLPLSPTLARPVERVARPNLDAVPKELLAPRFAQRKQRVALSLLSHQIEVGERLQEVLQAALDDPHGLRRSHALDRDFRLRQAIPR